ncbi:MAG: SusC/RagA family TonB-linked outer membrane protein [Gemmatimonadales bacterium]|nr:MAG: SusC/RagA family TonB-linked outer membrane protein [Gemmatimonadales bacterium]
MQEYPSDAGPSGPRTGSGVGPRVGRALSMAFLTLLVGVLPAMAQQGAVTGQVVDRATLRPMNSVQIVIQGQNIGSLTDVQGRFRVEGVPAGEVTVQAQILGYGSSSQTVNVPAGGTVEVDFQLQSRAIDMDEIVVTGTGAPTQRRQLGQTINSVSSEDLQQAPITGVADALLGRVPGIGGQAMGEAGASTQITLRGVASLNTQLRNEPLIYVDGVRMDNRTYGVGGTSTNRLGDINPADIDRIEVIKGAAAATLFGTEASSGVIQIFTRRGAVQAPVWSFGIDQQIVHLPNSRWTPQAGYVSANTAVGQSNPSLVGSVVTDLPAEAWIDLGYHQNYTVAVRGGSEGIQYSASARFMDEDGHTPNHAVGIASIRSAFDFNHSERVRSSVDLSVVRNTIEGSWPSWSSVASDFLLANPANATERLPHGEGQMPVVERLTMTDEMETTNVSVSASLQYDITDNLVSMFRVGHNDITQQRTRFAPEGAYGGLPGLRQIQNRNSYATTLDANLNWSTDLTSRVTSTTTVGGQSFWEGFSLVNAQKSQFASPTLSTLTGASVIASSSETIQDVINAGFFGQQQFGLDNRLFLTIGVRMDGNSAFGDDFGLSTYPKVGFSWVVSDYDFFDISGIDEFRIRGAIGTAGLQPGAFDAQRTWNPSVFAGGVPQISPSNLGNPELKPERSTEREIALEALMMDGRLGIEAIYFQQITTDALLSVSPPPSSGFTSTQLQNIGEMQSWGIELMGDLRVMDSPSFSWDLNAAYTYIDQEVTDMGGISDIRLSTRRRWGWIAEGHRPGVLIAPKQDPNNPYTLTVPVENLTSTSQIQPNVLRNEDGSEMLVVHGDALPSWTVDFGSTFRFGQNVSVRALFTGAGGFLMSNETEVLRQSLGINEFSANVIRVLADPNSTTQQRQEAADAYGQKHWAVVPSFFEKGDWLKLNELSVNYDVAPEISGRFGLGRTSLMIGARNLHTFTSYSGLMDPGQGSAVSLGGSIFESNIDYISAPSPRRYVFSIRTTR